MTIRQNFDNLNDVVLEEYLIKVLLADKLSQRVLELLGEIPVGVDECGRVVRACMDIVHTRELEL